MRPASGRSADSVTLVITAGWRRQGPLRRNSLTTAPHRASVGAGMRNSNDGKVEYAWPNTGEAGLAADARRLEEMKIRRLGQIRIQRAEMHADFHFFGASPSRHQNTMPNKDSLIAATDDIKRIASAGMRAKS